MDADKAAARLSEMSEDLSLIRDILENMTEKQAAAILQEMDVDFCRTGYKENIISEKIVIFHIVSVAWKSNPDVYGIAVYIYIYINIRR